MGERRRTKHMAGIVQHKVVGDEKNQKDYYDQAKHYDAVWGQDNIHLGYYPHLVGPVGGDNLTVLNNKQAADCLTKRMIDVGRINHKTTLLDLGCGKGQACKLIAQVTGAKCVGVDIGTANIKRANEVAAEMPDLPWSSTRDHSLTSQRRLPTGSTMWSLHK